MEILPGKIGVPGLGRAEEILRWRVRKLLDVIPARPPTAGKGSAQTPRIVYYFAGTYGDFVQALPALQRLAAAFPRADLVLAGETGCAREFVSEIPSSFRLTVAMEPGLWALRPMDMLFTNAVGVYRVRFDFAARFYARRAFGFRHDQESRRSVFFRSLCLDGKVKSFAEENLKLLDLAEVSVSGGRGSPVGLIGSEDASPPWGKGRVLFHIGSVGLKRDFGMPEYSRLVLAILKRLEKKPVEVVMGPGDEDIGSIVRGTASRTPQSHPLARLIRQVRSFEGTVLCFNSFMAHLCEYLGKPAIVIHRRAVPYGYHCLLHRQIVLHAEEDWDLGEVWAALGQAP